MTEYEYLEELDLYFEKQTGYFYKQVIHFLQTTIKKFFGEIFMFQGFSDFYHADSQYCCHFNYESGQYEWIFDPVL